MINIPTAFILGAGASAPYGLPLGATLRKLICEANSQHDRAHGLLVQAGMFTSQDISAVAKRFRYSNVHSIDEYLTRNEQDSEIGKALIAINIALNENMVTMVSDATTDHWYHHLWRHLLSGCRRAEEIANNDVSFITFNYDRSLELFLQISLKNTFQISEVSAYKILEKIKVVHVYGSIGDLYSPTRAQYTKPYNSQISPREVHQSANCLHIIPEGRENSPGFIQAESILAKTQRIYVLGFGFDETNCSRLKLSNVLSQRAITEDYPQVTASTFGMTRPEVNRAKIHLAGNPRNFDWVTIDDQNTMVLRKSNFPN